MKDIQSIVYVLRTYTILPKRVYAEHKGLGTLLSLYLQINDPSSINRPLIQYLSNSNYILQFDVKNRMGARSM